MQSAKNSLMEINGIMYYNCMNLLCIGKPNFKFIKFLTSVTKSDIFPWTWFYKIYTYLFHRIDIFLSLLQIQYTLLNIFIQNVAGLFDFYTIGVEIDIWVTMMASSHPLSYLTMLYPSTCPSIIQPGPLKRTFAKKVICIKRFVCSL